jgi:hypothetical protein
VNDGPYSAGTLHTTFLAALLLATVNSVAGKSSTLPRPREYGAIILAWTLFGLVAGLGRQATRWANSLSLAVLITLLVGGSGVAISSWLSSVAKGLAGSNAAASGAATGPSSQGGGQTV